MLLTPPMKEKIILAFDPGFVNGCKLAVIDKTGKYLDSCVVKPFLKGSEEKNIKISKEVVAGNTDIIVSNYTDLKENFKNLINYF